MNQTETKAIQTQHTVLHDYHYDLHPVVKGYANRTLYINVDSMEIVEKPVDKQMKHIFTGGRGFCLWLLWQAVYEQTKWNSPENELVIAGGPIGATAVGILGHT
jgi:aldehyde:ferredoxin oxidoreductase